MYQRFSTRFVKFKHLNGLTQSFEAINHAMVDFWFVLHLHEFASVPFMFAEIWNNVFVPDTKISLKAQCCDI